MNQNGIIVGVNVNDQIKFDEEMRELANLCEACNIHVVGELVQNVKSIHPKYYLGKGKLEELNQLIWQQDATVVVFYHELTPAQIKYIDEITQVEVLDRTGLILDIFASRAKTREAKLQVEVVGLKYQLPRLAGLASNLSRQAGGIGGGAGGRNKGAGEKKIELNRRKIDDRITFLEKELDLLSTQRTTQRNKRMKNGIPSVALVGYTNAGKSSVMNYMVQTYLKDEEKMVLEKDMLFATLETSVRNIRIGKQREFILSDTVGFVSNLPHNLVRAFHSTLEEACTADLLLHVVDRSNPDYKTQMEVTKDTLREIGADHIPVIYVYNKADLCTDRYEEICNEENSFYVSAKTGEGMEELVQKIGEQVFPKLESLHVLIPYHCGNIIAKVNAAAHIVEQECREDGMFYTILCDEQIRQSIEAFAV